MLNIKKYANGRFYDTVNKKYIKVDRLREMVQRGEEIKVILTRTGKDITDIVVSEFSRKKSPGASVPEQDAPASEKRSSGDSIDNGGPSFLKVEGLKKWATSVIEKRLSEVVERINLPTRDQVAELDASIKALNRKFDDIKAFQEEKAASRPGKKSDRPVKKKATPPAGKRVAPPAKKNVTPPVAGEPHPTDT